MARKFNRERNVYEAALDRMRTIFQNHEKVIVSFSGGKDSTVIAHLAREVAAETKRSFYLFYLDQEIEYSSTIDFVDEMMKMEYVIPLWFQIPCLLTNTSSMSQNVIDPWNPEKKSVWIRGQKIKATKAVTWNVDGVPYTFPESKMYGFYGLVQCMEALFRGDGASGNPETSIPAQLIGLRADESLDRFRAVTKNPGMPGVPWSTRGKSAMKYYPIYDWQFRDIWIYLGRNNLPYNKMYDYFHLKGYPASRMRLSNLLHEKAYECIADLQEFEPKLYDRMLDRCMGIATAQEYAGRGGAIFKATKLPKRFKSWKEYRDYLLNTLPNQEHADIFRIRFSSQFDNDYVVRQQVNRILIYDVNNFKKINNVEVDPSEKARQRWMAEF
jgi:predicted phosphoadenosine phosphosulfate sulfurtransferase